MRSGITVMRNVEPEVWYEPKRSLDYLLNSAFVDSHRVVIGLTTNNDWVWQITRELRSSLEEIE